MEKRDILPILKTQIGEHKNFAFLYTLKLDYINPETNGSYTNKTVVTYYPNKYMTIICRMIDDKPFWCVNMHTLGYEHGKNCYAYLLAKSLLKKKIEAEPDYRGTYNEEVILDYCRKIIDKLVVNWGPSFYFDINDARKEADRRTNESKYRYESKVVRDKLTEAETNIENCQKSMINLVKLLSEYKNVKQEYEKKKDDLIKAGKYFTY